MAGMKKGTRSKVSPFTINMIFEKIEDQKVLRSAEGRYTFPREEKVESVFPSQIGEYLRGLSSASYYSWFLHGQENGGRIRAKIEALFSENPMLFVQEMAEKCRAFLCPGGEPALDPRVWEELLDELGKNNPMFVRDTDKVRQLQVMSYAAPQRVLTVFLLAAGMNDFSEEKYEEVLACWHLMDRDLAAKDYSQPRELARTGQILYADGLRKEALDSFLKAIRMIEEEAARNRGKISEEELLAELRCRVGEMILHGDGCTADEEQAADYFEDSFRAGYIPAFYQLAMLRLQAGKAEKAADILREGARRKDAACLRMLGNACYSGDILPEVEKDPDEAVRYYYEGACFENPSAGDAQCQYMLGRILEENRSGSGEELTENRDGGLLSGAASNPVFWLEAAARGGNRDAAALLNRLQWGIAQPDRDAPDSVSGSEKPRKICFLNSNGEKNSYFAGTLPAGLYSVQICSGQSMARMLRETVEEYISGQNLQDLPEILLMAMDEDEQKNLRDALEVLGEAAKLHARTGSLALGRSGQEDTAAGSKDGCAETLFYLLSERLRLYVCGNGEAFAPVLDSACTRMGDFYIPLYLCDPEQMASAWLLDRMPLFIPCMEGDSSRMDTIIFGDHPGILRLCKDAVAAAQISEIPFSLTVIGDNADELEERFLTDCPGLEQDVAGIEAARPVFIKMHPESRRLQELLSVRPKKEWTQEEKELSMTLQAADYLVVYTAEEDRNLTLSMFLREWYLKTDPSFVRLPFIAAYCGRQDRAVQFRTLSVGAEEAGFDWYNNYDIHCFGAPQQLFSYDELVCGRLEQCARSVHLTYYGIRDEKATGAAGAASPENRSSAEKAEVLHRALRDYFSRQYNRDNSRISALALNYRLFSAGITFPDWHSYLAGVSRKNLAQQFEKWLRAEEGVYTENEGETLPADPEKKEQKEHKEQKGQKEKKEDPEKIAARRLEILSMQEHDRWCRSMLSRGWMPANAAQMQAYIQRGCTRHQLYLAKLHPFLCAWDELGELKPVPTGMQRIYGYLLQQVSPGKEPSDIRGIDRENVKMTAYLLGIE